MWYGRGILVPPPRLSSCPPELSPACSLASFPGGTEMPKERILAVPCDVLIPAAIGGVITEANAGSLQCTVRRPACGQLPATL